MFTQCMLTAQWTRDHIATATSEPCRLCNYHDVRMTGRITRTTLGKLIAAQVQSHVSKQVLLSYNGRPVVKALLHDRVCHMHIVPGKRRHYAYKFV